MVDTPLQLPPPDILSARLLGVNPPATPELGMTGKAGELGMTGKGGGENRTGDEERMTGKEGGENGDGECTTTGAGEGGDGELSMIGEEGGEDMTRVQAHSRLHSSVRCNKKNVLSLFSGHLLGFFLPVCAHFFGNIFLI